MRDALRRYAFRKTIEAGPITGYDAHPSGRCTVLVTGLGGADSVVDVPRDFFFRGKPAIGDFFIAHSDGRVEWMAKAAFEQTFVEAVK